MDDNSEGHMETDVSSTTDDVLESQEVTASHGDVEMIIVVENVNEDSVSTVESEDTPKVYDTVTRASLTGDKTDPQASDKDTTPTSGSNIDSIVTQKSPSKISPQKVSYVQSPAKEVANVASTSSSINEITEKVTESGYPVKEGTQNVASSGFPVKGSLHNQTSEKPTADSTKTEPFPPKPIKEKSAERTPVKSSLEIKTIVLKAPLKVYRPPDLSPLKEIMLEKTVPVGTKEEITVEATKSPTKEATKISPTKEGTKLSPTKEVTTLPPTKEVTKLSTTQEATKLSPTKEAAKLLTTKEITKLSTTQEATKLSPTKEATKLLTTKEVTKLSTTQEATKLSPTKEATKLLTTKEITKLSPTKEATKLLTTKEITKLSPTKEATKLPTTKEVTKLPTTKEVTKLPTTKEVIKLSTTKEVPKLSTEVPKLLPTKEATKLSTTKEVTKLSLTKEVIKPSPIKGSTLITTNINGKVLSPNEKEVILYQSENSLKDDTSPMDIDKDSNSQASDTSEKEHNKSISRELKSLINSAKESKIISECNQVTSKTRKSRNPDTSLNISVDADRIQGNRRGSNNSQISNCSEKSDKIAQKRSMRSQNPEFVSKCKQFLNAVTSKVMKDSDEAMSEDDTNTKEKEKEKPTLEINSAPSTPKRKKIDELDEKQNKLRSDPYCWRCHYIVEHEVNEKAHPPVICTVCPRSFHYKCLTANERKVAPEKNWVCPDCMQILQAESSETRSPAMKKTTLGMLCELLKYALERMMDLNGVEPFLNPVDRTSFPDYDKYVVHPMDLNQMKQNIADGNYGSTEAFVADTQWILHNSIIFNTCEQAFLQSKLTGGARALVRSCRAEMGEIEACPECYSGAHARRSTWFTDVCSTPHILLWAKLKGFPYWPAKGMTVNSSGLVDVRFFGAHDRAWVPAKDCFLYSEKDPNNFRSKRQDIIDSMQEAEHHIRNISRKYGKFVYPPFKTQFDPTKMTEQLKMMIPTFEGEIKMVIKDKVHSPAASKDKRRSNSKSSKASANEGDVSESDDAKKSEADTVTDEMNTSKNNNSNEKNKTIDKPITPKPTITQKDIEIVPSRKRRRSNLEEAILTIIEHTAEKKKKNEDKSAEIEPSCSKDDKTKDSKKKDEKLVKDVTESAKKVTETKSKDKSPKDNEPSSSTDQESQRVTPIKLVALPRTNKLTPKLFTTTKVSPKPSPKEDDKTKDPQKSKKAKLIVNEKEKRRNSRNRSSINATSTPKADKFTEKKTDTDSNKEKEVKSKEGSSRKKDSDSNNANKTILKAKSVTPAKNDRIHFDDDINLAILAREARNSNSGLPTISSVRSLSTTGQNTSTTTKKTTTIAKSTVCTEVTEANSDSSIFTPTSTDNVRNMKDAVSKLQKLRNDAEPVVGRVGVKAFARMTEPNQSDDVQVEIKAEPIDLDEENEERQMEKMDLMNACKLRPVSQVQNPSQTQSQCQKAQSLRDVRINKVVVAPTVVAKKTRVEIRPRAKKTFPQPKRTEEGRSELNGKNSMVYIPIQPPITQAPIRGVRPGANGPNTGPRPTLPVTSANSINTVTSPLRPTISTPPNNTSPPTMSASTPLANIGSVNQVSSVGQVPTVGPTTVHTVPLMTSVNGQWMFSLQPVMSLGGIENTPGPVNGVPERSPAAPPYVSLTPKSSETVTPGELPRLQQRPTTLINPLAENAPLGVVPTPSTAGPLTAKLNQNAVKLTDFFRNLLEDTIERVEEPVVQAHALKLQLEQMRWRHQQEMDELKHNHDLSLAEMRTSLEKEKVRVVTDIRRTAQLELETAVKAAKAKQWCANCSQEAQFYCCWNTSYCDYPCQRAHWPQHFTHCTQQRGQDIDNEENAESRQQSPTDNLPKSAPIKTPALTVGCKITPTSAPGAAAGSGTRVYAQESAQPPKSSIIVSMVEDSATGNQTMKCVGTYKSPQTPQNVAPLIINKQLLNEDSAAKKVVTSGGYLIVGAAPSSNSPSVITPAPSRRSHTIQYYA